MLESLAAWVLNTYIGEYLENLNTDQLSIALLQGQVELEHIPLKKTALKKFDIPLSVKSGVLGKLALKVPLAHLRSEPWVVAISDLYVLLEPSEHLYDVELDEESQQNKKQQQLDALESFHKKQIHEISGSKVPLEDSQNSAGWLAYGASLVSAIVENIHLKINNVHIRYEDDRTLTTPGGDGKTFSCGIKIKQMTVQTTNRGWAPGFIQRRDGENLFKVLDLTGLSVYWDSDSHVSMPEDFAQLIHLLDTTVPSEHNYVLHPISAQVKMEKNSSKFPLKSRPPIPRFRFDLEPESLKIELSKRQMLEMRLLTREWARYERSRQHRKWRPKEKVAGNSKLWWKFAVQTQLESIKKLNERKSWKFASTRARQVNAYCRAYRRRIEPISVPGTPSSLEEGEGPPPPKAKKTNNEAEHMLMKQIERDPDYSYEDLHILRDAVFRRVVKIAEKRREEELREAEESQQDAEFVSADSSVELLRQQESSHHMESLISDTSMESIASPMKPSVSGESGGLYGWLASWFGASPDQTPEDNEQESSSAYSFATGTDSSNELPEYLKEAEKQLEEGILDVLHESWDDSTLLRRDTLLALVQLRMKETTVTFIDELCTNGGGTNTQILAGHMSEVIARLRLSPRHHVTSLDLTVGDLSAHSEVLKSAANEPSLLWSRGLATMFALGKAACPLTPGAIPAGGKGKQPLMKCFYERRAPSMSSKHTLDVTFAPISVMYHAAAYESLTQFFDTGEEREKRRKLATVGEEERGLATTNETTTGAEYRAEGFPTEIKATFRIPSVSCELRSELSVEDDWTTSSTTSNPIGATPSGGSGKPFACAHLRNLELKALKTEEYRMVIEAAFSGFELEDLLEGENTTELRYLIKSGGRIGGLEKLRSTFVSNSCPDIAAFTNEENLDAIPSSLPVMSPTFPDIAVIHTPTSLRSSCVQSAKPSRRGSMSQVGKETNACSMKVALTSKEHPRFSTVFNKVGCTIGFSVPELDVNMNQQTWVLLLEFLGIIASPAEPATKESAIVENCSTTVKKSGDKMEIRLETKSLELTMNTPASDCQLGRLSVGNVNAFVEADDTGVRITGTGAKFQLKHSTPGFSRFYPQKLFSESSDSQDLWLEIFKFSGPDPKLNRDFDLSLSIGLPSATYVHCHRFFMDLLNYWLHFFQLMDMLTLMKAAESGQNVDAEPGHGARVLLKVDIAGPTTLVLPVNSLCDSVIVAEMKSLTLANNFLFASQKLDVVETQTDPNESNNHDCLLDVMHIECQQVTLHSGIRVPWDGEKEILISHDEILTAQMRSFAVLRRAENCLAEPLNLNVVVERNLDGDMSHSMPDLAIHTHVSNTVCVVTQDLLRTIRGFLENNLGEELPAAPAGSEFIRRQDTNATVITGKVWAGLSFHVEMTNLELRCLMKNSMAQHDSSSTWAQHGDIHFKKAHLSFESFSDGTRELDLICQKARLVDSRFEDTPVNKRGNVFERVMSASPPDSDGSGKPAPSVLAEVHFLAGKGLGPKLTILLSNVRILAVFDWWNRALEFLVSTHEFGNPVANEKMTRNPSAVEAVMPGVVVRRVLSGNERENELGITLNMRDSDLVFLEDSTSKCSLAVLLKATCVLHWRESEGIPKLTLNAQQLQLLTTFMSDFSGAQCSLSDQFSLNVDVLPEESKKFSTSKLLCPGLLSVHSTVHKAEVTIMSDLVLRMSYRDYLVTETVWRAYSHYLFPEESADEESAEFSVENRKDESPSLLLLQRISVRMGCVALWFLDDFQDTRFPLFRVGLKRGEMDHFLNGDKPHQGQGSLELFSDYFNQSQYGWEPMVEPWTVDFLSWTLDSRHRNLELNVNSSRSTFDINLTQSLLRQMNQFWRRWPEVQQNLSADFRTGYTRSKTDHLPYLLKNMTGSLLYFTTETKLKLRGKQWQQVERDQSMTFSFPSRQFQTAQDSSFSPHQLIIRVQGWNEIQPVSVDSVGTYFRLAKPETGSSSSSPSSLAMAVGSVNARVVIAVTMDQDGRKVVTVRSALAFVNALPDTLELKLENFAEYALGDSIDLTVKSGEVKFAPMQWAMSKISARPVGQWSVQYCRAISWQHVDKPGAVSDSLRSCEIVGAHSEEYYRMAVSIKREFYPERSEQQSVELPGHTLTFLATFTVINLLPVDLSFFVPTYRLNREVRPGGRAALTVIDLKRAFEFGMATDSFRTNRLETVHPGIADEIITNLYLIDSSNRQLRLILQLKPVRGAVQLSVEAPVWFVNKSGLPLIVKQEGSGGNVAAGQFGEHEKARAMLPLMFSFAEEDGGRNKCALRVGKEAHPGYLPLWSDKFVLDPGIAFKQLVLTEPTLNKPPMIYNVGVEVRPGQGAYKNTRIVLVTPLFQLDNRSKYKLYVAQERDIHKADARHLAVSPNCYLAWHWQRQDLDKYLCVKRADLPHWSAGFRIDMLHSFHLNIRDKDGSSNFLRIEVILHGAVYYCTFSDTENLPPPIRLENWSEVPVMYRQQGLEERHLKQMIRPHTALDYSWDDVRLRKKLLEFIVFGTKPNVYDLNILGQAEPLVYENNFYITLAATFQESFSTQSDDDRDLVLEALPQGKIVLSKMHSGNQHQLWRMTVDGHLINVGGAQHQEMKGREVLVLDVLEEPTHSDDYEPLILRKANSNNRNTQKWIFTKDNRLVCQIAGFFVQACHQMLKSGSNVVLGATKSEMKALSGVPAEQWIQKRRQKAGSGGLGVSVVHEGPTRVLKIMDLAGSEKGKQKILHRGNDRVALAPSRSFGARWSTNEVPLQKPVFGLELTLTMTAGLGLSVINSVPEELVYCRLSGIFISCQLNNGKYSLGGHVVEIQADNQLLIAERFPVLFVKTKQYDGNEYQTLPALKLEMQWTPRPTYDAFECFNIKVGKVALRLEEILLWKLVQFLQNSFPHSAAVVPAVDNSGESKSAMPNLDLERPDTTNARRCYFGRLEIDCPRLYLTMVTTPNNLMPSDLLALKQAWNVPLVRFDQAPVHLKSFGQSHYFETLDFLVDALQKHYTQQLKNQALKILGTVDFLGNPLGLFQDVTGGLKELIIEGNVGGFVGGVGHGVTNSVSKLTSSLSEGLGKVAPDEEFSRLRDSVKFQQSQEGNDALGHLYTGVKGLGIGIFGGATSLISQTVTGAQNHGVKGLATGFIKGTVGTFTKPVQGVLDFATGAASATREMVSGASGSHKSRFPSTRLRLTRVTKSLHGTLPEYSSSLAMAQQMLMNVGQEERNRKEICLNVLTVMPGSYAGVEYTVLALVCTEKLYIINKSTEENWVRLAIAYSQVENCAPENIKGEYYMRIFEKGQGFSDRGKRIKCSAVEVANQLCQQVLYAKQQHDDLKRSLPIMESIHLI